jgi:hypothetical protein
MTGWKLEEDHRARILEVVEDCQHARAPAV